MNEPSESAIERLLTERGMEAMLPVRLSARRMGCAVWQARLYTPYGDADAQIQVYPLGQQPESIVDIEEEITALTDGHSGRVLAREIRDDEWGILVTCAAKDVGIFERFFEEGLPDLASRSQKGAQSTPRCGFD